MSNYERYGYGLSEGSPYYESTWGKTIERVAGFHSTDGSVIGLVFAFTDGTSLHLVPVSEASIVTGES